MLVMKRRQNIILQTGWQQWSKDSIMIVWESQACHQFKIDWKEIM